MTTKQAAAQTIMVEVATASLTGKALNYAVATVEGWEFAIEHRFNDGGHNHRPGDYWSWWRREEKLVQFATFDYSTKWEKGGPLITEYAIGFLGHDADNWLAFSAPMDKTHQGIGPTHLIAACRMIVASHFGDTVSVPVELVEASV